MNRRGNDKLCIFCESPGPFNEEHCFDQWLNKGLLDEGDVLTITRGEADYGTAQEWIKDENKRVNMITRAVCEECNGGWIHDLGELCEPLLGPMLDGNEQLLVPESQRILSRWATKVAMTHDSSFFPEGRQVDPEWYQRFFEAGVELPDRMLVWIGRYIGRRVAGCWTHRLRPFVSPGMSVSGPFGFCSLVVVGQVLFNIVGVREEQDLSVALRAVADRPLIRICPESQDVERWPPWKVWDDDSTETLCQRQVWGGDPVARPGPRLWIPPKD